MRDQRKYAEYQREYQRKLRKTQHEEQPAKVDMDDLETYLLIQRMRKPRRDAKPKEDA